MPRKNKKSTLFPLITSHKVATFLIGFALIGSLIAIARAATSVSDELFASSNLAYGYTTGGAVVIERDSNGQITSYSRPRAIDISKDGKLYCTPPNKAAITTRPLTADEIDYLTNELFYSRPSEAKDPSINGAYIGDQPTIYIDGFDSGINGASYTELTHSELVKNAAAQLEKFCDIAGTPIPSGDSLDVIVSSANSAKKSLYQSVANALAPTVYAGGTTSNTPSINYFGVNADHENAQHILMANSRKAVGLPATQATSCLNSAARDWTRVMVSLGYIRHSDNIVERPVKYCGSGWTFAGENVGVSGLAVPNSKQASEKSSQDVFRAFMDSPGHRANILHNKFTHHGIGSYTSPDGKKVFVTQLFWQGRALPK